MNPIPVNLATEDELSEMTLLRVLAEVDRYAIGTAYRRGGFGYLRRTIHGWNSAAKGIPFIVLTDLDASECPARLLSEWLRVAKHPNLLFRVAVHEVESWILADPENLAEFLRVDMALIPPQPDTIADPKGALIKVARKSHSKVLREGIVPARGSTAKQGPDYNGCLGTFIRNNWHLETAKGNSPSLARTVDRIRTFTPVRRVKSRV
jgi:hypothetical protein